MTSNAVPALLLREVRELARKERIEFAFKNVQGLICVHFYGAPSKPSEHTACCFDRDSFRLPPRWQPFARRSKESLIRDCVRRTLARAGDMLVAIVTTDIPSGAVWLARGATRVFDNPLPLPPITVINRLNRTYQRHGDAGLRPWPEVAFYTAGRTGIVERRGKS